MLSATLNMNEIYQLAEKKAIREGYDQIIFRTKRNGYEVKRTTSCNVKKSKIIGYIRLIYRDNMLSTRLEER